MGQIETPKILAVDTSSMTGSVALCEGDKLVAESLLNVRATHSEKLLQQIDLLLQEAGWKLNDVDLLVAVTGPGSFTGLRIGIATVKGLAQVLNKPVVGVSSLQMVALNVPVNPLPVCVFIDARKKEVYTQQFDVSHDFPVALNAAQVLPPERVLEALPQRVVLVGDAVPLYRSLIEEQQEDTLLLAPATAHQPRASQAAWLGLQNYLRGEVIGPVELLPTYIRPSDAELSKTK
ncbi:tRNA threonylcarbamoyladenosine biosynthesis protein TsaB [Malonomonas rubra DSM 5091]|uniref:tRNA threonylcarbamoyladenosine biosynthesis protein TsaB n=1 Tax=Malonomonas rubra DSM 5091 TaxID=1122189 RepID=A0A1M6BQ39_MALRU|nr:tRNA (adenosine(37)-N6)-threonylcarbamoyltransferase complex dimerization subunit type 1 TsaB [Malonomonas rubra]SHI50837.1 tRNA threonylcarbamoyladenosine biosynthesis protein TsaB [Malonomonas rubra DSM 5091]